MPRFLLPLVSMVTTVVLVVSCVVLSTRGEQVTGAEALTLGLAASLVLAGQGYAVAYAVGRGQVVALYVMGAATVLLAGQALSLWLLGH